MHPAVVGKNLGVWFHANFSFADHVRNICKPCFIQMRDIRQVRQYLTDEAAILVANVTGLLQLSLQKSVQSQQAQTVVYSKHTSRIFTNCNKYTRVSSILKLLHWFPVEFHGMFKSAT